MAPFNINSMALVHLISRSYMLSEGEMLYMKLKQSSMERYAGKMLTLCRPWPFGLGEKDSH